MSSDSSRNKDNVFPFDFVPELERRISSIKNNLPDPLKQPISYQLTAAYLSRVNIALAYARHLRTGGRLAQDQVYSKLPYELDELESWLKTGKTTLKKIPKEHEEAFGNFLVSIGYSYTETKKMLDTIRRQLTGRGAPNKHPETLKMLDARMYRSLSYSRLASEMCDCGAKTHTGHCADRIRKRIKELEELLDRYQIISRSPDKPPEKNRE